MLMCYHCNSAGRSDIRLMSWKSYKAQIGARPFKTPHRKACIWEDRDAINTDTWENTYQIHRKIRTVMKDHQPSDYMMTRWHLQQRIMHQNRTMCALNASKHIQRQVLWQSSWKREPWVGGLITLRKKTYRFACSVYTSSFFVDETRDTFDTTTTGETTDSGFGDT